MSTNTSSSPRSAVNGIRILLGVVGLIALVTGLIILWQPAAAFAIVTWILGIYAIVAGIVYLAVGIFSRTLAGWSRLGHIVLGLLFIVAGIVAFLNVTATSTALAIFFAVMIGITWIVEGIVALTALGGSRSRVWTVIFAVVSIIAGLYLLLSPLWGAIVLWLLLGVMLIIMGITDIIRALTFSSKRG